MYELIPSLDAILRAFYSHVTGALAEFAARDVNWAVLKSDIADLQASIQGLATREELNLISKRRNVREPEPASSGVGLIKCISCGRELPSNEAGSDEALRTHPRPPSSGRKFAAVVDNTSHSARSFRRAQVWRNIRAPY
jgi:hypothetical protein